MEKESKVEQWWQQRSSKMADGLELISESPLGQARMEAGIAGCPRCFGFNFTKCDGCNWECYCEDLTKTFLSLTKNQQEEARQKEKQYWKNYQEYLKEEQEEEWEDFEGIK